MQRELRKLDREIVICFKFLDTPGDEITPGSNKVRKHFENERFGHNASLLAATVLDNRILLFMVGRSQRAIAVWGARAEKTRDKRSPSPLESRTPVICAHGSHSP